MEILVNSVSVKHLAVAESVRFSDVLDHRGVASFTLRDSTGAYDPQIGQSVQIYDRNGVSRWGGNIENIQKILLDSTGGIELQITCASHWQRLEKRVVQSCVYESTTVEAVVSDLITTWANGENIFVTSPSVIDADGKAVTRIVYDYDKTIAQALTDLATLSNCVVWIDPDGFLFFVPRTYSAAPWTLTDAKILHRDGEQSVVINRSRSELRNRVWYRCNWAAFSPESESFVGNGAVKTFTLAGGVNRIERILVGTEEQSYGVLNVDADKQWYYEPGSDVITQDTAGTALTAAQTLTVEYRKLGADVIQYADSAAISARAAAETGTGIYETSVDHQEVVDATEALAQATAFVNAYKNIALSVEFDTRYAGLRAGMAITASVTMPPVSGTWLIESIDAYLDTLTSEDDFRYRVRVIDGAQIGGWLSFWERLAGTATNGGGISLGGSTDVPPDTSLPQPTQPTDWSVSIADTGATVSGQPQSMVRVVVNDNTADVTYFAVWVYRGGSAPADLSLYANIANQPKKSSGATTIDFWVDREGSDYTYQVVVTGCNASVFSVPSGSSTVHPVTVTAAATVAQPTGIAVTVVESDQGGVPSGQFKLVFTPPASSEYWLVNWDRRRFTDNTYTTPWPDPDHGDWHHFGSTENSPWLQPTTWARADVIEYWKFRAKSVTKSYIENTTSMPETTVEIPASTGLSSVAPSGDVSGISLSQRLNGKLAEVSATYTSPGGTHGGVVVYVEDDEQSAYSAASLDGTATLDGTYGVGGEWKPRLVTRKDYVAGEPAVFVFPDEITASRPIRVYLNAYNTAGAENALVRYGEAGATPSATITLTPRHTGGTGEEYCKNPTGFTASVTSGMEGGVHKTRVTSTWSGPVDGDGAYIEVPYVDAAGASVVNQAVGVGGQAVNVFDTPKTAQVVKARARGFVDNFPGVTDDLINSYTPGITPEYEITIGKTDGTVDLGEGIAATVAASMAVLNKVLGVAALGINEDLVATFAVSASKLKAAAVETDKIASGAVTATKIANLAVGNAHIQNAAISEANIQNAAVTTAKIANAAITNALIGILAVGTANIQDLAVTSAKIASLEAGKISAGTITASISINSPTINGGSITGATLSILSGMTQLVSITSAGLVALNGAKVQGYEFYDNTGDRIIDSSGNATFDSVHSVGAFKAGVGASTGQSVTLSLAKLTSGGTNGSATFTGGILTSYVQPT